MIPDGARDLVLQLSFMNGFPETLRERLADIFIEVSEVRRIRTGQLITREGGRGRNRGFILLDGSVRIHKSDVPDSKAKPPELLGEVMQFNPKRSRTATVTAHEKGLVLRFMWDDFWAGTKRYLTKEEQDLVRKTLEERAWEHFTA